MRRRAKRRLKRAAALILRAVSFGLIKVGDAKDNDRVKRAGEVLNEAASFGDGFTDSSEETTRR